jgi:hypothetical protein
MADMRRLFAAAVALTALGGVAAVPAGADTVPGNTPSNPVEATAYSNGCGGDTGIGAVTSLLNWFLDTARYKDSWYNPLAPTYTADFRAACDLHDAGYDGGIVFDRINGGVVDFRTWSRAAVDAKFLADLRTLCARQIPLVSYRWWQPGTTGVARAKCQGSGSFNLAGVYYKGAEDYYGAVRSLGDGFFDADPAVPGRQSSGPRANN